MHQTDKDVRVTARIPATVKETLQQAADLSGATLNQFIVSSALKEAHQILETERTLVLSERDAQTIFDLLDNPPTVNLQLQAAVEKHRAFFHENS